MVSLVECKADSDVVAFRIDGSCTGEVLVEVQDDPFETNTLITARLLPSQAIRLARALLAAAGVTGVTDPNAAARGVNIQTFTFID